MATRYEAVLQTATNIGFVCPEQVGYFGVPDNCSVYYRCDEGVHQQFLCPEGLAFHRHREICLDMDAVPECQEPQEDDQERRKRRDVVSAVAAHARDHDAFVCPKPDGMFPDPKFCMSFWRCANGKAVLHHCQAFEAYHPSHGHCAPRKIVPGCEHGQSRRRRRRQAEEDGRISQSHINFRCPVEWGYFRDPDDCSTFFWCVKFAPTRFHCGTDEAFNEDTRVCSHPSQVPGCSKRRRRETEDYYYYQEEVASTKLEASQDRARAGQKDASAFHCPESYGYFPDPNDCAVFYLCYNGGYTEFRCSGDNEAFDPKFRVCGERHRVPGCEKRRRKRRDVHLNLVSMVAEEDKRGFECPASYGYFADAEDCAVFYLCYDGGYSEFRCSGKDAAFDVERRICSERHQVPGCTFDGQRVRRSVLTTDADRSSVGPQPVPYHRRFDCSEGEEFCPHPTDCHRFFHCRDNATSLETCSPGFLFGPDDRKCEGPDKVAAHCDKHGFRRGHHFMHGHRHHSSRVRRQVDNVNFDYDVASVEPPLDATDTLDEVIYYDYQCPWTDGFFRHPMDCRVYFRCTQGAHTAFRCGTGTLFNPRTTVCSHATDVPECAPDGRRLVSAYKRPAHSPESGRGPDTEQEEVGDILVTKTVVKHDKFRCPSSFGYFRHPADCSYYFHCTNGGAALLQCGVGTIFDPINNVCTWPDMVPDCTLAPEIGNAAFSASSDNGTPKPGPGSTSTKPSTTATTAKTTTAPTTTTTTPKPPAKTTTTTSTSTTAQKSRTTTPVPSITLTPRPNTRGSTTTRSSSTTSKSPATSSATTRRTTAATPPPTTSPAASGNATDKVQTSTPKLSELLTAASNGTGHVPQPYKMQDFADGQQGFVCPRTEGFFRDSENCAVYYHCLHGVPYRWRCSEGTIFHLIKQRCLPVEQVTDCYLYQGPLVPVLPKQPEPSASGFTCPDDYGFFRDMDDCSYYFECIKGHAYRRQCLQGTLYDPVRQKCTWTYLVKDCKKVTPPPAARSTVPADPLSQKAPADFRCPVAEGYFRDDRNCSVYYHCIDGLPLRKTCRRNSVFDVKANMCLWMKIVEDCDQNGVPRLNRRLDMLKDIGEQVAFRFACPLPNGHFRDGADCSLFFHCVDDVPYAGRCGQGKGFDVRTLSCVNRTLIHDCLRQDSGIVDFPYANSPGMEMQCPMDNGYIRDDQNCSIYYHCVEGVSFRYTCRHDTVFDAIRHVCTWAHLVQGCLEDGKYKDEIRGFGKDDNSVNDIAKRPMDAPTGKEDENAENTISLESLVQSKFVCPPHLDGFYRDEKNCLVFYRCVHGLKYTFSCPKGTFFDSLRYICNFEEKVTDCSPSGRRLDTKEASKDGYQHGINDVIRTTMATIPQFNLPPENPDEVPCPDKDGLFPHPRSCEMFLYCSQYVPIVLQCPRDLMYNVQRKTCDYPEHVVCKLYDNLP